MVFCIQNSDFSTRIASLYGSQPSTSGFACKRATFGSERQVFMGPRLRLLICEWKTACLDQGWRWSIGPSLHLLFRAFKTATLAPELQVSMGACPHLWFCAFTTATLWPEVIVSMGPRPYLSFCAWKTAWLASELLAFMVPDHTCRFCMQNNVISIRNTSLYGFQTSPMFFLHSKQRLFDYNY